MVQFSVSGLGQFGGSLTIRAGFEPAPPARVLIRFQEATLVRGCEESSGSACAPACPWHACALLRASARHAQGQGGWGGGTNEKEETQQGAAAEPAPAAMLVKLPLLRAPG